MQMLVGFLAKGTEHNLRHLPYKQVIEACGGVQPVTDLLSGCIDPGVADLEGKIITVEWYLWTPCT